MRILFDECVPWPMHTVLAGHECVPALRRIWSGLKNGELLARAQGEFDLFITAEKNLRFQQSLARFRIAVLLLSTNKLRAMLNASTLLKTTVDAIHPGELRVLQIPK